MSGQGMTRPGRHDKTPEPFLIMRGLDAQIDAMQAQGHTGLTILMTRSGRRALREELRPHSALSLAISSARGGYVVERYCDLPIRLVEDDALADGEVARVVVA